MKVYNVQSQFQGGYTTKRKSTEFIVLHHAAALYPQATGLADVAEIANYHTKTKGWPGIGYGEVVAEEVQGGALATYVVSDPDLERAHVFDHNDDSFGICLATNFDNAAVFPNKQPSQKWFDAAVVRIVEAKKRYLAARVVGHKDIAVKGWSTACPGTQWASWKGRLLEAVKAQLNANGLTIFAPPRMTEAEFNATLERAKSPAFGAPLYAVCIRYGVDPAVALAFFAVESTYGLEGVTPKYNTKNWGNVRTAHRAHLASGSTNAGGKGPFAVYPSWQAGLEDWCLRLKEKYDRDLLLNTVERVVPVYAPLKDGNLPELYVEGVKTLVARYSESEGYPVEGVDPVFVEAHKKSGGVWQAPGVLTPGLPLEPAFLFEERLYQRFERGTIRRNSDGSLDWLFSEEIADLLGKRAQSPTD